MPVSETTHVLAKHGKIQRPTRSVWEKISTTIVNSSTNKVVGGIHLDDLGSLAFWLALLFVLCNLVAFAVILFDTTTTQLNKKFLSLTVDTKGALCNEVPQQLNGVYQGDTNGYWQTNDMFRYNLSIFQLSFSGRGVTNEQYTDAMQWFTMRMAEFGNISVTRNTLWSLNTWASFTLTHHQTKLQLSSNVDAGLVYSGIVMSARLYNAQGACAGTPSSGYGNGWLSGFFTSETKQITLRQPTPLDSRRRPISVCPDQIRYDILASILGSRASTLLGRIDYGFDVRLVSLIVGLNTNTLTLDGLLRVDDANARSFGLIGYIDTSLINPPQPYPVYCLDKSRAQQRWGVTLSPEQMSGPEICFILTSLTTESRLYMFYPYVEKINLNRRNAQQGQTTFHLDMPMACSCPRDQLNVECAENNVVIMLFYDLHFRTANTVQMAANFQQIVVNGITGSLGKPGNPLGVYLANLIQYGHAGGFTNLTRFQLNTPLYSFTDRSGVFWDWSFAKNLTFNQLAQAEFQMVCSGQCGTIFFRTYSAPRKNSVNMPINRFNLNLGQLSPNPSLQINISGVNLPVSMCVDTFSQPQALARLTQAPPVRLIQNYFECTSTLSSALMTSIGNAAASARLYVGLSWAAFGVLFVFLLRLRAKRSHEIVLTQHAKADIEAAQAQIRNELIYEEFKELRTELLRRKVIGESHSRLDSFKPLFYEQRGTPRPEDQEALERVGAEISHRLHQAKQADEKGSAAYSNDETGTRPRITLPGDTDKSSSRHQSFTGARNEYVGNVDDTGRGGSRRLSVHPMGFVLSSTQPRSRASLVSSLVVRGSIAKAQL